MGIEVILSTLTSSKYLHIYVQCNEIYINYVYQLMTIIITNRLFGILEFDRSILILNTL